MWNNSHLLLPSIDIMIICGERAQFVLPFLTFTLCTISCTLSYFSHTPAFLPPIAHHRLVLPYIYIYIYSYSAMRQSNQPLYWRVLRSRSTFVLCFYPATFLAHTFCCSQNKTRVNWRTYQWTTSSDPL